MFSLEFKVTHELHVNSNHNVKDWHLLMKNNSRKKNIVIFTPKYLLLLDIAVISQNHITCGTSLGIFLEQ